MQLNLHQITRPYKIDVYGLQDNYIGCLQSYKDTFLGQVVEPRLNIKTDGTQTFTCKIPKFYLSEIPNERVINPRWQDAENGVLAENTRVLKVSVQFSENDIKIFPFIIDKITNKRDSHFSVYKEVECNGLAFSELGKQGYKVELNSTVLEEDYSKDDTIIANINYWLDKIFPNEKDEEGYITKWLTPWCYEIRMDWRGYFDQLSDTFIDGGTAGQLEGYNFYNGRDSSYLNNHEKWLTINPGNSNPLYQERNSSIIYENPYVSNWDVVNEKLVPVSNVFFKEKARYVECANSNKYNITQTLAEIFEVFCTYEYACEADGHFKKTYYDEDGNLWTGKKVVFFNRAIKTDKPYIINYQHNLNTISRVIDSSEVYTKLYVKPIASNLTDSGYVTIADTNLNPLLDDFILNFDYLYSVGSISELQKEEIEKYKVKLHKLNKKIIEAEELEAELTIELNKYESQKASEQAALDSVEQTLVEYEAYLSQLSNEPVIKGGNGNAYSIVLVPKTNMNIIQGQLRLEGINIATIAGYSSNKYEDSKKLFVPEELIHAQSAPSNSMDEANKNKWYITKDEYGYPDTIFTNISNTDLTSSKHFGDKFDPSTGAVIYLSLEYFPLNKYETIVQSLRNRRTAHIAKINNLENIIGLDEGDEEKWTGLKKELKEVENNRIELYKEKENLNFKFERLLGPALREGYWQPDTYEDPGEGHNVVLLKEKRMETVDGVSFIYDEEPFEDEQENYYYASNEDIVNDRKTYYPYIELPYSVCSKIGKYKINDITCKTTSFHIVLHKERYDYTLQNGATIIAGKTYYFLFNGKYYSFVPTKNYGENDTITICAATTPIYIEDNSGTRYTTTNLAGIPENAEECNLTRAFMGAGQYLSERHLYNGAGFTFSYLKIQDEVKLVALLNNVNDIDYSIYTMAKYYYDENSTAPESHNTLNIIVPSAKPGIQVFPRLFLDHKNVNADSENFKIYVTLNAKKLTNFEDYQILEREARVYVNLKITDTQLPIDILEESYNIIFQISRANEQLYLDAKQVAKDSSKPKYSYEIQVSCIPDDIQSLELGQLCHINDYSVDVYKEYGYVSELNYVLEKPSDDSVIVANYKAKFEDLFSTISAQSEAMKTSRDMYNIAIASFTPNGEIETSALQSTLDNNNIAFNFSESYLKLDDTGGLVITNKTPYSNGVRGQLALRGGGLFCSDTINSQTNERVWSTAITPSGINASLITTGQIDTSIIRILSGGETAFQWNAEGLYSYRNIGENGENKYDNKSYIKLNENGLLYMLDDVPQLELDWDGLKIQGANGHMKLTSEIGLQMLNEAGKAIVTFGKYGNYGYGMFFTDGNGKVTLQAHDDGYLHVVDKLYAGNSDTSDFAGICGNDNNIDNILQEPVRFWAGSSNLSNAPFSVTEEGRVKAASITINNGSITFRNSSGATKTLNYNTLEKLLALIP